MARGVHWRRQRCRSLIASPSPTCRRTRPPSIRSITVSAQAAPASAAKSASASASSAFSITVTDTGDATSAVGTQAQTLSRPAGQQLQISWQADDPDGDKLSYSLYFRGEDEREWKLLRADISENTYLLDGDVLADGRYFFRVVASDRPSNAAEQARQVGIDRAAGADR